MDRFDPATHTYYRGDRKVPSVTAILANSGLVDASFCSGVIYLDRGTLVHDFTARQDQFEYKIIEKRPNLNAVPKKWRGHVNAWAKFRLETGFAPNLIEHRVFSCGLALEKDLLHFCSQCYAGTLDRAGKFKKNDRLITILDIKNAKSGRVQDSVRYQLVAYGNGLDPKKMFHRVGVSLHEDGSYSMNHWGIDTYQEDLGVFMRATAATHRSRAWSKFMRGGK